MASQPDVLQSCVEAAAKAGRSALERCIDDAVAGLQIAETQSPKMVERDQIAHAWLGLQQHKAAWAEQYPAALLAVFAAGLSTTARAALLSDGIFMPAQAPRPRTDTPGASSSGFSGLDSLRLVDDDDVSQAIESSRLLQQVMPAVEQPLAELDKLISSAQGLPNVRPELNPLRPEVFANSLRELVFAAPVEPAVQSLWLKYLALSLGRELKLVYERIVNQLEMAHVQGASYRVLPTPAGSGRGGGQGGAGQGRSGASEGGGAPGRGGSGGGAGPIGYISDEPILRSPSQYADLSRESVHGEMFEAFLLRGGNAAEHGLAPAYYDNIEEELRALKAAPDSLPAPLDEPAPGTGASDDDAPAATASAYGDMPVVDRPQRPVHERSQLSQKVWGVFGRHKERALVRTELKKEARRVGQVMGLEVVRQLVNQVAQDPRLLAPVREGIVALEPSLLRLAMVDPRFFSDDAHAGRRLMERVAQRSFKYNDEFSPEFVAFFEPVKTAFNALNRLTIADAEPFNAALADLENGWDAQDAQETAQRNAILQALRFAEQRQTEADQIAFDLSERSDLDDVPALVLDFLFGPWALAMAHARLTDTRNQVDPQGLGLAVPDLIWSAKRQMTMRQPAKLIEMIPGLLARLHAGLDLLGKDPRESEPFFKGLMRLHQPVLKLRRLKSQRDAEESADAPLEPEAMPATPAQRRARAADQPWMGRSDLAAAGFEDTLPSLHGELQGSDGEAYPSVDPPTPADDDLLAVTDVGSAAPHAVAASADAAGHPVKTGSETSGETDGADAGEGQSESSPASITGQSDAEATLLSLRSGAWVDLYSRRRWLRAQLVWASN
ncbi:DUF1631 family protein, partial [Polaromonas sp.]|uniref:DUF1631 family protein n=1 Tax=Polaromonas sp. TaxID=1869339 RepID=UPI002C6A4FD1